MKKIFLLIACLILTACAGRTANPIMVQQYGDTNKSCEALEADMSFVNSEMSRLLPETSKTGKNVALGVTGAIFLVPLFFMDFSKAEQIEVDALRQRYHHLNLIAQDKKCNIKPLEAIENNKQ